MFTAVLPPGAETRTVVIRFLSSEHGQPWREIEFVELAADLVEVVAVHHEYDIGLIGRQEVRSHNLLARSRDEPPLLPRVDVHDELDSLQPQGEGVEQGDPLRTASPNDAALSRPA